MRDTERQRHRQREKQARSCYVGLDPRTPGSQRWAIFREQRREERCSVDISDVANIVRGTGHPRAGRGCSHPQPPAGKGGKPCTVHGRVLTRRIHNVQPNLQAPILSAACVD
ncbi:unnamed protein product [Nyctereutes procyonoides]|uniref:(raccoon dog) hypothetical protein n=1 Tax=Nyctereutes procyonoides TaxID=34880 RepID=A0A811ZGL5_NYCPR|nr:unnamed protein product [Nyctereutes procyonoides]